MGKAGSLRDACFVTGIYSFATAYGAEIRPVEIPISSESFSVQIPYSYFNNYADNPNRDFLNFFGGKKSGRKNRWIKSYKRDSVIAFVYLSDGSLIPVDLHDAGIAAPECSLYSDNGNISRHDPRRHGITLNPPCKIFSFFCQICIYFFVVLDIGYRFDWDACCDIS